MKLRDISMRFLGVAALLCFVSAAQAQMPRNPVVWSTSVDTLASGEYQVSFTADIAPPWRLYDLGPYEGGPNPTSFTFELSPGMELSGSVYYVTPPVKKFDGIFRMEIGYFQEKAVFAQNVKLQAGTSGTLKANVYWMVCDDNSCLAPTDKDLAVTITAAGGAPSDGNRGGIAAVPPAGGSGSVWSYILEAILWGFAALLTPCVFPMVPLTVSFFIKGNENRSRGRFLAAFFGISIVALYTVPIAVIILVTNIAGGQAVTADIFNWLATHWFPNVLFFIVFMLFAASFFGAFEIRLPGRLINKSDSKADRGGIIGTFFLALTLVLVSFSCTGPIVGTVLIKSTAGEIWAPVITMFAFSVAFALPFTLFAFFPTLLKNLPKSGGWLNSVKVTLGFLELALGLKFLSVADQTYHWGILDREVYLALWIVVFTLLGFYLLGKIRFARDEDTKTIGVARLFLAIVTFSFVVYMVPGMWGAPLKGLSGYLPPMHTQDFVTGRDGGSNASSLQPDGKAPKYSDFLSLPHGLQGFFDFDEAVEYAKTVDKPLFVDYTGHGCVNCREMEARVWSAPEVLALLRDRFVIVALYSDDKKHLPESEWVVNGNGKVLKDLGRINADLMHKRFGVNSQPYYMILGRNGGQLVPGMAYNLDVKVFEKFLLDGLDAYGKTPF